MGWTSSSVSSPPSSSVAAFWMGRANGHTAQSDPKHPPHLLGSWLLSRCFLLGSRFLLLSSVLIIVSLILVILLGGPVSFLPFEVKKMDPNLLFCLRSSLLRRGFGLGLLLFVIIIVSLILLDSLTKACWMSNRSKSMLSACLPSSLVWRQAPSFSEQP